ncbi:helix-turn-helix domain-containing protein [Bordetella holmesii]|uniref:DNA-binding helix-turn-helix protein n=2 Tax=Bordetella holmesii TaxID=35814 RepID=A0A158M9K7_9BORD|nr:helix-turn-helix domain-containing protein [Bordetella holmesii]AHV94498.1 helix-turn-helix domain protein [Bordetella holmesii ATCC 51541]AIT25368.1 helix-turn-helix domain protein [Bordetella holmesii 44057]EWM45933.1 helix-turn-helix domain protein [Bordetella holmesii 70147]EWM48697.1 helix-turn-helix domain protein [Bordetella holmesii 41130]EWM50064.1 helix-turn-helix domain protein [Bordetella holmesii 35009]
MTQDLASAVQPSAATPAQGGSVGAALQSLRQAKGWSLEEVSSRIKFSTRQLEALEAERWDELPTGVSLRGLIRNYARLLGADPTAIVGSLDGQVRATAPARLGASRSLHGNGLAVDEERTASSWGWIVVIIALLAVGVAYAFWQGWLPQHWLPSQWFSKLSQ